MERKLLGALTMGILLAGCADSEPRTKEPENQDARLVISTEEPVELDLDFSGVELIIPFKERRPNG